MGKFIPNGRQSKIEEVIRKVQKLLALADQSRNPSEAEAIAASMQAQKLLAKYNLEIADITGEEKKEEIEQVIADVGTGNKWKYTLANAIADSYCCKCYYHGAEMIVFYGYQSDVLIARRVFMYLFKVGNSLATKYVKARRDAAVKAGMDPAKAQSMAGQKHTSMLEREATAEEQAASILFLASPDASHMTGATVQTDGGWTSF